MGIRGKTDLAKGSIGIFSTQVATLLITTITTVVLARVLGPSGKGAFSLITFIPLTLVWIGHPGMGAAIVYFLGKKKCEAGAIVNNVWIFDLVWGAFVSSAVILALPYLAPIFFKDIAHIYLALPLLVLPVWFINQHFAWVFLAQGRIRQYNLLMIANPLVFSVLLPLGLWLSKWDIAGAVVSWMSAVIAAAIISIMVLTRITPLRISFDVPLMKDMVIYGLKAYLGNILLFFSYRFDLLLVSVFLDNTQVGLYSIALAMAEVIWRIPNSIGLALFPKVSSTEAKEGDLLTPVASRNTVFIALLACIPYAVFGKPIVALVFGEEFVPLVPALWLLLPGVALFSVGRILVSYFIGSGRPTVTALGGFASVASMVALDIVFIPRWGIEGAAAASTVSYVIFSLVMLYTFAKSTPGSFGAFLFVRASDVQAYVRFGRKGLETIRSSLSRHDRALNARRLSEDAGE